MASFFKKKDSKEELRANERALRKNNRDLEGDRRLLARKEEELKLEIKKLAAQGQHDACKVLAKQLLRLHKQKTASTNMSARMNAIGAVGREMYHIERMSETVAKTTEQMKVIEKKMPPEKLAKNMREFVAAQERLGITDELVTDTLDSMLEESGDEEEQDAIVNKVLDEIGIDLTAQLSKTPKVPSSSTPASMKSNMNNVNDDQIEKLLNELKS